MSNAALLDLQEHVAAIDKEAAGLMRVYYLAPADGARLLIAAAGGDAWCLGMLRAVGDCVDRIAGAPKRLPVLCLTCPAPIRNPRGLTFLLAVPETEAPHHAVGAALCQACAARSDLEYRATIALRQVWPDLRAIEVMPGPGTIQ